MTDLKTVTPDHERPPEERHPLGRPAVLKRLRWGGLAVLALLLAASLFVHGHPHFTLDALTGFYAGFGLLGGIVAVAVAMIWGKLFQREDGYYD